MSFLSVVGNYPVLLTFALITLLYYVDKKIRHRPTLPLPPGPKRLPLVGNLFNAPPGDEVHKIYHQWTAQYGSDVLYMKIATQPVVILNTSKACIDLLEKRSNNYSDRPYSAIDELLGLDFLLVFMGYNQEWRSHRKLFHQYFNSVVSPQYASEQVKKTREFLSRSLKSCEDFSNSIRLTLGSSILKVVYGVDVNDLNHPYIQDIHAGMDCLNEAHTANKYWIDFFPMFKNIPKWIPGVRFKRFAEENKSVVQLMRRKPYDDVKAAAETSPVAPSMTSILLGELQTLSTQVSPDDYIKEEEMAINVTGIAYAAGTDTSSASVAGFFVALATRPEIQRKAQAELNAHIGLSRLVDDSDYNSLPYISAIALEVMRFRPAAPLGVPHRVMEDDEYNGYLIPKGAMVFSNIWAALRDPNEYPNPDTFDPERFLKDGKLDPSVRDPGTLVFGFGRRICPGRHFSNMGVFLIMASVLQVYNIEPAKDSNGDYVDLDTIKYAPGVVATPDRVPCVLKVRSEEAKRLILEAGDAQ
ncbi:cytochrome P450 [Abortiporus biennis]|nr:cytochrome P450 [Abortiporus biennis]